MGEDWSDQIQMFILDLSQLETIYEQQSPTFKVHVT